MSTQMTDYCRSAGNGLHLDARKRVNYSLGLVLGEEEFRQDQLHLRERDHLANRALHGYGTISGLDLTVAGNEVRVGPGLALDAAGRFVCVPSAQCADLDRWFAKRGEEVAALLGSPPASSGWIPVYVSLCYLECETDKVPLPLEPCRTGEDSMVPSRVSESFELRLSLDEPDPAGEVTDGAMEDAVEDLVAAAQPEGSPPASPPMESSPPASPPAESSPQFSAEMTEDALHDWAVTGRPLADRTACLDAPMESCVPLGCIIVPVDVSSDGSIAQSGDAEVDDADRPVVASTRFLQEWLTRLTASEKVEPFVFSLDDLVDVDTSGTDDGDVLTFQGGEWVPLPNAPGAGVTSHGDLTGLEVDDHGIYVPADGSRSLTGPLNAGDNRLTKLADAVDAQDAVTLAQLSGVMRNGDEALGDLIGSYPAPLVARLLKRPIADIDPERGDALVWNGEFWAPAAVEAVPAEPRPRLPLPFTTITRLYLRDEKLAHYEIWFNVDAPANQVEIRDLGDALTVRSETNARPGTRSTFLRAIKHELVERRDRNVFVITLSSEPTNSLLRFQFVLKALPLETGETLAESAEERGIVFEGQDAEGTVTKFVRIPQDVFVREDVR
jgi:hypothetical protein